MITTSTGAKKIEGTDNWRLIFDAHNDTVDAYDGKLVNMVGATSSTAGTQGLVPAPAAGKQSSFLRGDGTWVVPTNTTYSDMVGATSSAAGTHGLVPAPASGNRAQFLRGDGSWATPTNTTYSDMTGASSSAAGTHGLVPAPAKGKQASFLRGDGTWVVPTNTNTWRGYQLKSYSFAYSITSQAQKNISGTNFGISTPSGYTPVAALQVLSGNIGVIVTGYRANQTGSEWVVNLRNMTTTVVEATAYIQILYLQTGSP